MENGKFRVASLRICIVFGCKTTFFGEDFGDLAVGFRLDLVHALHGFDNADGIALLDLFARVNIGVAVGRGGGVKHAYDGSVDCFAAFGCCRSGLGRGRGSRGCLNRYGSGCGGGGGLFEADGVVSV